MREDLEQILMMYQFEFNCEQTRNEIKHRLESYLMSRVITHHITDFKVEDRTPFSHFENQDSNVLYFQIIYQPTFVPHFNVIDISLLGNSVVISDFEKNVVGKRWVPNLGFKN